MLKNMKNTWIYLVWFYLIVSQFCALYFWYLYAQTHGFWSSLILGFFVAELKSIFWPLFL